MDILYPVEGSWSRNGNSRGGSLGHQGDSLKVLRDVPCPSDRGPFWGRDSDVTPHDYTLVAFCDTNDISYTQSRCFMVVAMFLE